MNILGNNVNILVNISVGGDTDIIWKQIVKNISSRINIYSIVHFSKIDIYVFYSVLNFTFINCYFDIKKCWISI